MSEMVDILDRRDVLRMFGAAALVAGIGLGAQAQGGGTVVYELRTYHTVEGRLDALLARFRDHTLAIFKRHGMESVAYWTPLDAPLAGKTLVYVLRHPSREAATANWKTFQDDPEWVKVKAESEASGKIVEKVESVFLGLTDFSAKV